MMDDDFQAATERINAGAQVAPEAAQIEHVWEIMSRIPTHRREHTSISLGAFAGGNPDLAPPNPEQLVALMMRYAMLDALIEEGILNNYMEDDSRRNRVFAAAASIPINKNNLSEALAQGRQQVHRLDAR
jgi:hypothetical protein